ncbi:MAG: chromate efflux transporter [Rubrivivax sp.]
MTSPPARDPTAPDDAARAGTGAVEASQAPSLWPQSLEPAGGASSLQRATGFDPRVAGPFDEHGEPLPPRAPTRAEALRYWLRLGCISFGGPAGQIALMHEELVERRRWISEGRFLHALNYCMLLPGPEAQQLATYLGWLLHRTLGGVIAGVLFVLPSLVLLVGLAAGYMAWGDVPLVAGLFYGIKPAVVALVVQAAHRLATRTLRGGVLWAMAIGGFVAVALLQAPFPLVVLVAAGVGALGARIAPRHFGGGGHAAPAGASPAGAGTRLPALIDDQTPTPAHARFSPGRAAVVVAAGLLLWLLPMAGLALVFGTQGVATQMGAFFTQAALLTFGGAYAVLPFVYQGAVVQHGWVSAAQMMDGLALGESTPGPLIMVVAFVAFVGGWQSPELARWAQAAGTMGPFAAGALCALVATWFTFLPSFVFILAGGPLVESTRGRLAFTGPLTAITAAVCGVILNLALFFGAHVLWPKGLAGGFDVAAALIGVAAGWALLVRRRGVIEVLGASAVAGALVYLGLPASLRLIG